MSEMQGRTWDSVFNDDMRERFAKLPVEAQKRVRDAVTPLAANDTLDDAVVRDMARLKLRDAVVGQRAKRYRERKEEAGYVRLTMFVHEEAVATVRKAARAAKRAWEDANPDKVQKGVPDDQVETA